jgi:hypothetical protein
MKDPNQPHPKPFYTPIANEGTLAGSGVDGKLNSKYVLEPSGYGMKFVSEFAGGTLLPVEFNPGAVDATAYAVRRADGKVLVAVINKDATQPLRLAMPRSTVQKVLTAPSLSAAEAHILMGPAAEAVVKSGPAEVVVPASTAAMLLLHAS